MNNNKIKTITIIYLKKNTKKKKRKKINRTLIGHFYKSSYKSKSSKFSDNSLYLFLIVTSVTPATSATSF